MPRPLTHVLRATLLGLALLTPGSSFSRAAEPQDPRAAFAASLRPQQIPLPQWERALTAAGVLAPPGRRASSPNEPLRSAFCPEDPRDAYWWDGFNLPVAERQVSCAVVYGGQLVIGGDFERIGNVEALHIARWDGSAWHPLGSGVNSGVRSLAVFNGELIAGGYFDRAGDVFISAIARWDGVGWSALGDGLRHLMYRPVVEALLVHDGALYAGGQFNLADDELTPNIARWDGTSWTPVGEGLDATVQALAIYEGRLVAGGSFRHAGTLDASLVAAWDGTSWDSLGAGITNPAPYNTVTALAVHGERLVVGGDFTEAGGVPVQYVASWDGSSWGQIFPLPFAVSALAVRSGVLHAAGYGWVGGSAVRRLGPNTWEPFGSFRGSVECLLPLGDALFVGGSFSAFESDDEPVPIGFNAVAFGEAGWRAYARWEGEMNGLMHYFGGYGNVQALAADGPDLIAAGAFNFAGRSSAWTPAQTIARWDGLSWHAMGQPPGGFPYAVASTPGGIVAGGYFYSSGFLEGVIRWDGSSWQPLAGLSKFVRSLATFQGELYAGVVEAGLGDSVGIGVFRWNGLEWNLVGATRDSTPYGGVIAMAVHAGRLVVGGKFKTIAGVRAENMAAWDGTHWEPLGDGLPNDTEAFSVYSLLSFGTELIAGGEFMNPHRENVMSWKDGAWSGVGSFRGFPTCLAANRGRLYAAGYRYSPCGPNIAEWNGTDWIPLGSGVNNAVWSMLSHQGRLFLGGAFTSAGGKGSMSIARWDEGAPPPPPAPVVQLARAIPNPFTNETRLSFVLDRSARVRLALHDLQGREVRLLMDQGQPAGTRDVLWDGRGSSGEMLPPGVYFAKLEIGGHTTSRRVVLLR